MFGWFKFVSTRQSTKPVELPRPSMIRTDLRARAMIDEYRARYSLAPIGVWDDCVDKYFGIGFAGCTGHSSKAIFANDGSGQCIGEDETVHFVWKSVGDRVVEVRCVERIPPLENCTAEELEEDSQWHRVEYDFIVPTYLSTPVIYDVQDHNRAAILDGTADPSQLGFLQCFCCLWNGPLKFRDEV